MIQNSFGRSAILRIDAVALALVSTVLILGCTARLPTVPPVVQEPTNSHITGKFVWHDLLTHDVRADTAFYGPLFGWEFTSVSEGKYVVVTHNGTPIGGIVPLEKKDRNVYSQWLSYLSVPDVDSAAELTQRNGGRVYREPFDLPGRGRVAIILDPEGAPLALVKSIVGDPLDVEPVYSRWLWNELWTEDKEASLAFYTRLVGYERDDVDLGGEAPYTVFRRKEKSRAGAVEIQIEGVEPHWLPYITVKNPAEVASRAKELGGKILLSVERVAGVQQAVVLADPSGAVFAIQQWPYQKEEDGS
ncbi:MAG: VOC family protein [Bacteroidota bacterium]